MACWCPVLVANFNATLRKQKEESCSSVESTIGVNGKDLEFVEWNTQK